MRIAILSMQRVYNYGSFLQAYGLKKMMENRGHNVVFIDIQDGDREGNLVEVGTRADEHKRVYDIYTIKRMLYKIREKQINVIFNQKWKDILCMTEEKRVSIPCDAVIIGSDEVFNCNKANPWGISLQLFGEIDCAPLVLSYAASCGYTNYKDVPPEYIKPIKNALNKLKEISVRDSNTAEFVSMLTGRKVEYNLDPVLMYDFSNEVKEAEEHLKLSRKYMIVYAYKNRIKDKNDITAIKDYAKREGLKIISLGGSQYWADDYMVPTPFEMLAFFKNSECVITDTFHGTIMGAIFHKRLGVIIRESNKNKLLDLLERVGIEKHQIRKSSDINSILSFSDDYKEFDRVIFTNRKSTHEYFDRVGL